jgi:hypothetical protein
MKIHPSVVIPADATAMAYAAKDPRAGYSPSSVTVGRLSGIYVTVYSSRALL